MTTAPTPLVPTRLPTDVVAGGDPQTRMMSGYFAEAVGTDRDTP